jgi:tRNA (guanine-N7-)-methyltransferase
MTDGQQRALAELLPPRELRHAPEPADLRALFGRAAPVVVEIGFGAGEALAARAAAHPEEDHLGIEVHRPGVGRLLLELDKLGLANVRLSTHDAVEVLRDQLAPGSLDRVLLLFPDPWPKKRHHKRRIVQPAFAALVASRLKDGGRFHLATDWAPYAEHMREVLDACPGLVNAHPGWAPRPAERPLTRFERRGERLGHQVFDLEYRKGSGRS